MYVYRLSVCIVADIGCRMETLTNNGVTCFIHKSNRYRRYYVKRNKNVCWRCTSKSCKVRVETRDGIVVVKECGFHCHVEKVLNTTQRDYFRFDVRVRKKKRPRYFRLELSSLLVDFYNFLPLETGMNTAQSHVTCLINGLMT